MTVQVFETFSLIPLIDVHEAIFRFILIIKGQLAEWTLIHHFLDIVKRLEVLQYTMRA